jgi:type II secretion system protein H
MSLDVHTNCETGRVTPCAPETTRTAAVRDPRRRGFTLIELMIVVVIIGIMAVMIVPDMRGSFEDALLRSSSRELVNLFTLASSRAVSLNTTHRVLLDRRGRYRLERKAEPEEGATAPGGFVPVREVEGGEGTIDPRITMELQTPDSPLDEPTSEPTPASVEAPPVASADQVITFHPDGSADGIEILLRDRQGFRRLLRLNPTTSRVSIVEPDAKAAAMPTTSDEEGEVAR